MEKRKEYSIPSRDWPVTVQETSDILVNANEIKANKALYKAAIANLKKRKKALEKIT